MSLSTTQIMQTSQTTAYYNASPLGHSFTKSQPLIRWVSITLMTTFLLVAASTCMPGSPAARQLSVAHRQHLRFQKLMPESDVSGAASRPHLRAHESHGHDAGAGRVKAQVHAGAETQAPRTQVSVARTRTPVMRPPVALHTDTVRPSLLGSCICGSSHKTTSCGA